MKKFNSRVLAFIIIFPLTIQTGMASSSVLAQSLFFNRSDVIYPVPADNDVLLTLGQPSKTELPAKRIKFLIWNLHKGTEDTFRIEYTALGYDRDIILNQEMFLDKNMVSVFRYMPQLQFTTATSFFSGKERVRTGVATASTVNPVFTKFVRTATLEPIIGSPKVALITSYPIQNSTKKLTVVNLHAINFVKTKSFRLEMSRLYDQIKDIPAPLVFAGDFNTWNQGRIDILDEYAKKLNLTEARFFPDNRMTFNGYPLDHFYFTSDIKIKSARVDAIYQGSDHKPLQVEVEYSPLENSPIAI